MARSARSSPSHGPGAQRIGDRSQGQTYHGPKNRPARPGPLGSLGIASIGGRGGCALDGLYGHGHSRSRRILPPPPGGLGSGHYRLWKLQGFQPGSFAEGLSLMLPKLSLTSLYYISSRWLEGQWAQRCSLGQPSRKGNFFPPQPIFHNLIPAGPPSSRNFCSRA